MSKKVSQTIFVEFDNNHGLLSLVGPQDRHILRIEQQLDVSIALRGNKIAISGFEPDIMYANSTLQYLFSQFLKGRSLDLEDVDDGAEGDGSASPPPLSSPVRFAFSILFFS